MSYNNNQSNDTRNSQLDPAGEPVTLIQNNCYSSAAPTVQSLDTTVATITFNSNLEDIPVPRLQMTNLICTSHPNALNKPQDFNNPITGAIEQQVIMEHVISPNAQSVDFRSIGDNGALGGIVIKRMTDGLYWNWNSANYPVPEWGAQLSSTGGTFNNGPIDWTVNFEAATVDTEYQVWGAPIMYTNTVESDYTDNLPAGPNHIGVVSPPSDAWKIFQLADISFTANFKTETIGSITFTKGTDDTFGWLNTSGTLVSTVAAGAILPTSVNNGVWDVDINVAMSGHGSEIIKYNLDRRDAFGTGLHDKVVTVDNIELPSTGSLPEILAIDCVTSITSVKTARILGTITLGNVGLESQSLIFPVTEFFVAEAE
jgi:hypothetical protein